VVLPKSKEELYGTYYLKSDLVLLCREFGLPTSGAKADLLERLCALIQNRPARVVAAVRKSASTGFVPSLDKPIDPNYSNNETHRAFFREQIGGAFRFNVAFMNWMEANRGAKSYREAIEAYREIAAAKKSGAKTEIGKQFEYNRYTRDFFAANPTLRRADCIKCWNHKKQHLGHHRYETDDLKILG